MSDNSLFDQLTVTPSHIGIRSRQKMTITFRPAGQQTPGAPGVFVLLFSMETRKKSAPPRTRRNRVCFHYPWSRKRLKGFCTSHSRSQRTGKGEHMVQGQRKNTCGHVSASSSTHRGWVRVGKRLLLRARIRTPGYRNQGQAPRIKSSGQSTEGPGPPGSPEKGLSLQSTPGKALTDPGTRR